MARRSRSYRKKSGVFATPAGFATKTGGARESVIRAAEIYADQAKRNAARYSRRIPAATHVEGSAEQVAYVVTDGNAAPNAAPFEFGERHPLFGNRGHWYKQPTRAYMSNAANSKTTQAAAAEAYATAEVQLLAAEYGYDE